jgi:hypothetical protein
MTNSRSFSREVIAGDALCEAFYRFIIALPILFVCVHA